MFLREAARPGASSQVLQGLGLSDAGKRVAQYRFYEIQGAKRSLPVGLDPEAEIFAILRVKYGGRLVLRGVGQRW